MGKTLGKNLVDSHGISEREKKLIRETWNMFCRNNPQYGEIIFVAFFIKHPDVLQIFPQFKDKKLADILDTPKFKAHAHAVGSQMSALVSALDRPLVFGELVHKNAANHVNRPGVEPRHFINMCQVILSVLQDKLGTRLSAAAAASWEKLFQVIVLVTKSAYEEAAENSDLQYATSDTTIGTWDEIFVPPSTSKPPEERRDSSFCCSRGMEPTSSTSANYEHRLVSSIKNPSAAKKSPTSKGLIVSEDSPEPDIP